MTGNQLADAQADDVYEQVRLGNDLGGASEDCGIHLLDGKREWSEAARA
jgi:hypothetical protein